MREIKGSGEVFSFIGSALGFGGDDAVSLRSKATLDVLFALSEGEIAGFPAGEDIRKYIYVNDTPILAPNGTENFRGVRAAWREGTQFQSVIPSAERGSSAPVAVGVKVSKNNGPVIRTVNQSLATHIRVTLTTPGISRTDDNGNVLWSEVQFKIYLATNGGPWVEKVTDEFKGKTSGGYARDYEFYVDGLTGPWQIKVERTSDDVPITNTKTQNDLYFGAYSTRIDRKFRYPNTALLFVSIDTAYFRSQPNITVKLKGLICRIPSNYNPVTRTYSGLWNGTWTRAYTNNPFFCLLEVLTNPRWGCDIDLARIDKWTLYRCAQYCDEFVSDGLGGTEPRFVYNAYVDTKTEAFAMVQGILAQCRGIAYYAGGQVLFSQDRPGIDPQDVFNDSNVVCKYGDDGKLEQPPFLYDYVSLNEKHSRAQVKWYDPNEYGKAKTAYADLFDIGFGSDYYRYGDDPKEVDLRGCTSGAEAKRYARWLLATERLEGKTIAFATGNAGLVREPGDLIWVADSHEMGGRYGGRIISVSGTTVTIDAPLPVGASGDLIAIVNGVEITKRIVSTSGSTLTIDSPYIQNPDVESPFIVSGLAQPELYRILAVNDNNDGSYGIAGILHSPTKYAIADAATVIDYDPRDRSAPQSPSNLTIQPTYNGYFVGWNPSPSKNVVSYALEWEEENSGKWTPVAIGSGTTDVDVVLPIGVCRFRVSAVSLWGRSSIWIYSTLQYALTGKVLTHYEDGSILLNKRVSLPAGKTWYLETYCENPAGPRPANLPVPYRDSRLISNPVGDITDRIYTSPLYVRSWYCCRRGEY